MIPVVITHVTEPDAKRVALNKVTTFYINPLKIKFLVEQPYGTEIVLDDGIIMETTLKARNISEAVLISIADIYGGGKK